MSTTGLGCSSCRFRKIKCDRFRPICGHCFRQARSCEYNHRRKPSAAKGSNRSAVAAHIRSQAQKSGRVASLIEGTSKSTSLSSLDRLAMLSFPRYDRTIEQDLEEGPSGSAQVDDTVRTGGHSDRYEMDEGWDFSGMRGRSTNRNPMGLVRLYGPERQQCLSQLIQQSLIHPQGLTEILPVHMHSSGYSLKRRSSSGDSDHRQDYRDFLRRRRSSGSRSGISSLGTLSGAESGESANSSFSFSGSIDVKGLFDLTSHRESLRELDLTGRVAKSDTYPVDSGGAADIYVGRLRQSNVAIKIFRRMHSDPKTLEQTSKALYETVRGWKNLNHVNVLPLLGISLDLGRSPALISPFCSGGTVMKYIKATRKTRQERLQLIVGVAVGLAHLHSQAILHGNLSTKKILVNADGIPVISGYDTFEILRPSPNTTALFASPIRFSPPEYFSDESGTASFRSESGDAYAFGMVMLEVLTGLEPFHHLSTEHAVFRHILEGKRPVRRDLDKRGITDNVWNLLTVLWAQDPSSRPRMHNVGPVLKWIWSAEHSSSGGPQSSLVSRGSARVPRSKPVPGKDNESRPDSSGEETSFSGSDLYEFHGRDLSGRVKQDDQYPFAGGGNSNLYRGKLTRSNGLKIRIAIKVIRISDDGLSNHEDTMRRMKREADVWSHLKHRNILPFIGVCEDISPNGVPALIAPYYKFGHVAKYVKKHPEADRQALVLGVASGLQFLHQNGVVHGDLKAQNVLVDKRGVACICDFGISKIANRRGFTTSNVGTAPYMAPELFFVVDNVGKESSPPSTTTSSDVYSFGLLVLEILTAEPPKGRPSRPIVTTRIIATLQPKREDYAETHVSARTWSCLLRCWPFEPRDRPSMIEVLGDLKNSFAPMHMHEGMPGRDSLKAQSVALLKQTSTAVGLHHLLRPARVVTDSF